MNLNVNIARTRMISRF